MSDDSLAPMLAALKAMEERLTSRIQDVDAGQVKLSLSLRGDLDVLDARMAELRQGVGDELGAKMTELRQGVGDEVGAKMIELRQRIGDELAARMSEFRQGIVDELGATRGAIMERLSRLQNALTEIRDDIGVNMGAADAAQRVNDNTREDLRMLRDQVATMWRQLKALEAKVRDLSGDP